MLSVPVSYGLFSLLNEVNFFFYDFVKFPRLGLIEKLYVLRVLDQRLLLLVYVFVC